MQFWELLLLALGLSMDAMAAAICKGLSSTAIKPRHAAVAGLYFGGFQALMPLVGYLLARQFSDLIERVDHWAAFFLLLAIGLNMIRESRDGAARMDASFSPRAMLPLALATSVDALAVGVTFAFLRVSILPAVTLIGAITFVLSAVGVAVGAACGARFKSTAERCGGIVLICMGAKILLEHLGVFP